MAADFFWFLSLSNGHVRRVSDYHRIVQIRLLFFKHIVRVHCPVTSKLAMDFVAVISSWLSVLHRFKDVLNRLELVLVVKFLNVVSFDALAKGEGRQYVLVDDLIATTPIGALVDLIYRLLVHVGNLLEYVHSWSRVALYISRGEVERWAIEKLNFTLLNGSTQLRIELHSVDSPALSSFAFWLAEKLAIGFALGFFGYADRVLLICRVFVCVEQAT